jgi:hypothetical protein
MISAIAEAKIGRVMKKFTTTLSASWRTDSA